MDGLDDALAKSVINARMKIDLLTLAIGPEHHDICLNDTHQPHGIIGRVNFDVLCSHIQSVTLRIKNLQCMIFSLLQSEISFMLKVKESHSIIQSNYTEQITPKRLQKEEKTVYDWIENTSNGNINNNNTSNKNGIISSSLNASMIELRSSNAAINFYDTVMVNMDNIDESSYNRGGSSIVKNLKNSSLKQKRQSIFRVSTKMEGDDENNSNETKIPNKASFNSLQSLVAFQNQFDTTNTNTNTNIPPKYSTNNVIQPQTHPHHMLKPKYALIGSANLNFFKILSEKDDIITKQSSKIFQMVFNEGKTVVDTTPKIDSPTEDQFIKFQIFDNITRNFSQDIYFSDNVIGKVEGMIQLTNIPLIRQIMCGVHTENGFDIHTINFHFGNNLALNNGDTEPPELKILSSRTDNLLTNLLKGTNLTQFSTSYREISSQTSQIMNEVKQVLEKSNKESCLFYSYSNNRDLFKAQKLMLELGIDILKAIESLNLE